MNNLIQSIDNITQKYLAKKVFAGSDVLIAQRGKILYHKAIGYAQLFNETGRLAKPHILSEEHLFDIASLTKVLATTQAIMLLLHHKQCRLEDSVYRYLPELSRIGRDISLRHLLTHSSGLPAWRPIFYHARQKSKILKFINQLPLTYRIDSQSVYSDFSFILLGYIIESISHSPLNDFIEKHLFQAIGMQQTLYLPLNKFAKSQIVATSHGNPYEMKMVKDDNFGVRCDEKFSNFKHWRTKTLLGDANDGNAYYAMQGVSGHAGVFSNCADLYHLGELILQGGQYQNTTLYSQEIAKQFTHSYFNHRALGWDINRPNYMGQLAEQDSFGHTGFTGTQVIYNSAHHLQLIILTNRQNMGVQKNGTYLSTQGYGQEIANIVYQNLLQNN